MRTHAGRVRRLAHGRDRDARAAGARRCSSACSPTTCAGSPRAGRSTACCAARTAACSTTSSPTGWATDRFLTVTNAANHEKDLAWFQRARRRLRRRRDATASTTTRCSPSRARGAARHRSAERVRRAARPRGCAAVELEVAGVPLLVCGTGYTGEDGVELLLLRRTAPGAVWDALLDARRDARSASARATRCASRSASTSTATTWTRTATRSRPAWAGAARRTRASSAPRPWRAAREPGPAEKLVPVRPRPARASPRQGNPVARRAAWSPAARSRRRSGIGIGMAYVPAERAEPGTAFEIDVRGQGRAAAVVKEKPALPEGDE